MESTLQNRQLSLEENYDDISYFISGMKYCFTNLSNLDGCLKEHDGTVLAIGVISGMVIFVIERRIDRKNRKMEFINSCKTILKEIDDHYDAFNPKRNGYKGDLIADNKHFAFVDVIQNIDAYESLIHSGFFTLFREKTQLTLVTLYLTIKVRNNHIVYRRECRYEFFSGSSSSSFGGSGSWQASICEIDKRIFFWECDIKRKLDIAQTAVNEEKTLAETRLPRVLKLYLQTRSKLKKERHQKNSNTKGDV